MDKLVQLQCKMNCWIEKWRPMLRFIHEFTGEVPPLKLDFFTRRLRSSRFLYVAKR